MDTRETLLAFPTTIPELQQSVIIGAALESGGHFEEVNCRRMQLDDRRRMFILLASPGQIDPSQSMQQLDVSWVPVNEAVFNVTTDHHPYESIGRRFAWMPQLKIRGRLAVDDIIQLPWRDIFNDERLPAKATVVVGTLNRQSELILPAGISGQEPGKQYYVFGQSIRTTDTVPDKPGGGTRMVA